MAAQAVRFFTGSSKTMTKSLLATLFKGQSSISAMPYDTANGVNWEELSFSGADEFFTIKDSFQISQADPTVTEIKISQKDDVIDTSSEKGEWTISCNIPVAALPYLNVLFTQGKTVSGSTKPIIGQAGTTYSAQAYFSTPKEVYATMLIEDKAVNRGIAFARVKLTAGIMYDDDTNPMYVKLSGVILTNTESSGTQGDWAMCEKYTA